MKTTPSSPTEVAALRQEVSLFGIVLPAKLAGKLLEKVGDHSLCVDALLMEPRPAWLEVLITGKSKQSASHS